MGGKTPCQAPAACETPSPPKDRTRPGEGRPSGTALSAPPPEGVAPAANKHIKSDKLNGGLAQLDERLRPDHIVSQT